MWGSRIDFFHNIPQFSFFCISHNKSHCASSLISPEDFILMFSSWHLSWSGSTLIFQSWPYVIKSKWRQRFFCLQFVYASTKISLCLFPIISHYNVSYNESRKNLVLLWSIWWQAHLIKAHLLKITKKWNFHISSSGFLSWPSRCSVQEQY